MNNSFINNLNDEKYFYSLIENLANCKVGFYSVGLYPASLAYNCAMHGKSNNILLAPREKMFFQVWKMRLLKELIGWDIMFLRVEESLMIFQNFY